VLVRVTGHGSIGHQLIVQADNLKTSPANPANEQRGNHHNGNELLPV
jgi:hypothetical protein